jgi:hypothetical protein
VQLTPEDRDAVIEATLAQGDAFFTYVETPTYYVLAVQEYLRRRAAITQRVESCLEARLSNPGRFNVSRVSRHPRRNPRQP